MTALPAIPTMFWHAMPPELNTSRLMAGAGAAPMLQAAAGWEAFAILLETQADELAASLAALTAAWSGSASERAVSATMPMMLWLRTTAMQAQKRAMQAVAQANSYSMALATTPPLVEIEQNHITHAVLEGTNFFGVNAIPIGLNEADYLIRMWDQAAGVMDAYQAETTANTLFEPILPMTPIVIPGVGEGTAAGAIGQVSAMAPGSAFREAAFAHVGAQATVESAGLMTGNMVSQGNMAATRAEGQAQQARNAGQQAGQQNPMQQGAQQGVQMATQIGIAAGVDADPTAAAGQPNGDPADAAVDATAAADDVDVQQHGFRQGSGGPHWGQPAVQPPTGGWFRGDFRRGVGARGVGTGRGRTVGAHAADGQPRRQAGHVRHAGDGSWRGCGLQRRWAGTRRRRGRSDRNAGPERQERRIQTWTARAIPARLRPRRG